MALTLKSTGVAADLISIVGIDDDGLTLRDFKRGHSSLWNGSSSWTNNDAELTVDNAVTVASGSWKGTTLPYFVTSGSGANPLGVTFNATGAGRPLIDVGSGSAGCCLLLLVHTIDTSSNFTKHIMGITGSDGLMLTGTPQKQMIFIGGGGGSGTTTIGAGTKLLMGSNYVYGQANDFFYGAESGSAGTDGSYDNGGRGSDNAPILSIGGIAGQGWCAGGHYLAMVFSRPLTTGEVQSIHEDPVGTLFEAAGGDTLIGQFIT